MSSCKAYNHNTKRVLVLRVLCGVSLMLKADASLKSLKLWGRKSETSVWSQWSDWPENCSVTCGIGVRRRTRVCNSEGNKRPKRCKGNAGELKNCDTELTCPVDGEWSKWELGGDCTASCGGGVGKRKRSCTNPEPVFGGKKCNGSAEDYGPCNQHKCPDQVFTLSPSTHQLLMSSLKEAPLSYEEKENATLRIPCKPELSSRIFDEYPSSILLWTKNGKLLSLDQDRMSISLSELTIAQLKVADSGVYVCSMRYAPSVVKILAFASIAVIPSFPNFMVAEEEKMTLDCNAYQMARIFSKVSYSWLCNETEMVSARNLTLLEEDSYRVEKVLSNMTGLWKCKVTDTATGRTWTTNLKYIKVLPPKSKFGTIKIFVILGLAVIFTLFLIIVLALSIHKAKKRFYHDLLHVFEPVYSSDESNYSDLDADEQ